MKVWVGVDLEVGHAVASALCRAAARGAQRALINDRMADVQREARKIKAKDFAPAIHRQALGDAGTPIAFTT